MSSADQSLKQQAGGQAGESTLPPVRGQAKVITTNKVQVVDPDFDVVHSMSVLKGKHQNGSVEPVV